MVNMHGKGGVLLPGNKTIYTFRSLYGMWNDIDTIRIRH